MSKTNDGLSNVLSTLRLYVETVLTEPHLTSRSDVPDSIPAFAPLQGRARCSDGAGTLSHLFFSDDDLDIARAKAVCRTCSLRDACLENALARSESYGVWGGTLLIDGRPVRFARRRGRPPAHRIETVADEVPIPDHLVA